MARVADNHNLASASSMDAVLVAASISSTTPRGTYTHVQTSIRNLSLADKSLANERHAPEHALYASFFNSPSTGSLVLRVIGGGYVLELLSLSLDIPPARFEFPSIIAPFPSFVSEQDVRLHVLLGTQSGSIYRIHFEIEDGKPLWSTTSRISEHVVGGLRGSFEQGVFHVHDTHRVYFGLPDGGVLACETDSLGNGTWREESLYNSSFLGSFIPNFTSGAAEGNSMVSFASHPPPTESTLVFTVSRDRMLRAWKPKVGCIASRALPPTIPTSRSFFTAPSNRPRSPSKERLILDSSPRHLLQVLSPEEDNGHDDPAFGLRVLVFMPTMGFAGSAGYFQMYELTYKEIVPLGSALDCSPNTRGCDLRDFTFSNDVLRTLWDNGDAAFVETLQTWERRDTVDWTNAQYAPEDDLTPARLEELLLRPGSMTDTFMSALLRPDVFSNATLSQALEEYTQALRALPDPPQAVSGSYSTVAEGIASVVGSTVHVMRDPNTGQRQFANYWAALKRDWEGFVARCRSIERAGRRPIALGRDWALGQAIVIETERIAIALPEDQPLDVQRQMTGFIQLLSAVRELAKGISVRTLLAIEFASEQIAHQEVAFIYAETIADAASRELMDEDLDSEAWLQCQQELRSLQGDELEIQLGVILSLVSEVQRSVKQEEDEIEGRLFSVPQSRLRTALITSYALATTRARRAIVLDLLVYFFFASIGSGNEEDSQDENSNNPLLRLSASLIAEAFAKFRGLTMLQDIARQPACDPSGARMVHSGERPEDDIASRLRGLRVESSNSANSSPFHSVFHTLVSLQDEPSPTMIGSAHFFMHATGLLSVKSPTLALTNEVLVCDRIRDFGLKPFALELLSRLPRTPAVSYLLARLWLEIGRADDAADMFLRGAANIRAIGETSISAEDHGALNAVLPNMASQPSKYRYFRDIASLFDAQDLPLHSVKFLWHAIHAASEEQDTSEGWNNIIQRLIQSGMFERAYEAIVMTPHEPLHSNIYVLVREMCRAGQTDTLMSWTSAAFSEKIEEALRYHHRINPDETSSPQYARVLYSWYIFRGDYRNAASVMYQRAIRFKAMLGNGNFATFSNWQAEALAIASNALSLLDERDAWIRVPVDPDRGEEAVSSKRRKLTHHIPEEKFSARKTVAVVTLADVRAEFTLITSRIEWSRREPNLAIGNAILSLSPSVIISKYAQAGHFHMAMRVAQSLSEDLTEIFQRLAQQCMRVTRLGEYYLVEENSLWLRIENDTSWSGNLVDRGWRYLRLSLDRYDGPSTQHKYRKAVMETLLDAEGSAYQTELPPWITRFFEENEPEHLIRAYLVRELLGSALECSLSTLRKANEPFTRTEPKQAGVTWLPYLLLDQVIAAAKDSRDLSATDKTQLKDLQDALTNRIDRVRQLTTTTLR